MELNSASAHVVDENTESTETTTTVSHAVVSQAANPLKLLNGG